VNWQLKSAAFRVLSAVPLGQEMHFLAQRHVVRTFPRPRARLDALWDKARSFVETFTRCGGGVPLAEATFVELGAGRDLSVPIALRLAGVGRVYSVDVARLAKMDLIRHAARYMVAKAGVPMMPLQSWADLEAFGIFYRAPQSLGALDVTAATVDCLCSNEVLEHLPVEALHGVARDTRRLLRPGGIAVHTIDYSDHYARSDRNIDRFNFLTFDEVAWQRHNSPLQYVNRLRHSDYLGIFRAAGLSIVEQALIPGAPTSTTPAKVATQFRTYSAEDLFGLSGRLVIRRSEDR
jgi:SAM-dependent methyltransferase